MIIPIDRIHYMDIYSDSGKKILEVTNGEMWNTTKESPIAVNKERFYNGDYIESKEDIDIEE